MKRGRDSRTAEIVCMGRAAAHGRTRVQAFSDPTALSLLPSGARARVERLRAGMPPRTLRERIEYRMLGLRAKLMVARTVAIDEAIRAAASPQLVILGAGLDGRAWRMPEVRDTTVFEVDHPDSQRVKRERASALRPVARAIRFVPVDFTRDRLDDALAAAGHDPAKPTTWIWEGVVMYLSRADIEATLDVIARRSSARSRLVVLYLSPSRFLRALGFFARATDEPLRSLLAPDEIRALVARFGFVVTSDEALPAVARRLSDDVRGIRWAIDHQRVVIADRAPVVG
jgi:methyltransferase (TIGR00027 family)